MRLYRDDEPQHPTAARRVAAQPKSSSASERDEEERARWRKLVGRLDAVKREDPKGGSSTASTRSRLSASKYRLQYGATALKVSSSQSNILWLRKPSALGSQ